MERVVKTEVQPNGEILIFYVDENGGNQEGVITTIEHIEHDDLQQIPETFIIEEEDEEEPTEVNAAFAQPEGIDLWLDEEIRRLLIFYIDNKHTFMTGYTKVHNLWSVACKTMLPNKTPSSCDKKLRQLKSQYSKIYSVMKKNNKTKVSAWSYFDLCSQAFHDGENISSINVFLNQTKDESQESEQNYDITIVKMKNNITDDKEMTIQQDKNDFNDEVLVKYATQANKNVNRSADEKVNIMLHLYLKYKDSTFRANIWDRIGAELGDNGQYWHKRFLNYKQHYIRIIEKQKETGVLPNWLYFGIFEQIFKNDLVFQDRYVNYKPAIQDIKPILAVTSGPVYPRLVDWNDAEKTVLVKYYFDCIDEFQDPTIPNNFLWTEIGRLLDKHSDACKTKYEALKTDHIGKILKGGYNLRTRVPLEILFDSIISKETEVELSKQSNIPEDLEVWSTEQIDELVQFFYDNLELFKDATCHFLCWAVLAKKMDQNVHDCRHQWRDLATLYKGLLDDKKEDPDMQIDWRYIELFDRIFDYGMDVNLLQGYEKFQDEEKLDSEEFVEELSVDDSESPSKRSIGQGDSKQTKILEFYLNHKDEFATSYRRKLLLWGKLAKKIGITPEQCAHRFRNLKQVYSVYVAREINKPEMPIVWPYYPLCKKVFGYRAVKNKVRNDIKKGKSDSYDAKEWSEEEITELIMFFKDNFLIIDKNTHDSNKWLDLTKKINRAASSCREKFLELRKSYRKIKTMISKNPECKVNWKYFKIIDGIYTGDFEPMDVKGENEDEEDDYECIIIMPEDGKLEKAKIIVKNESGKSTMNYLKTQESIMEPEIEITKSKETVTESKKVATWKQAWSVKQRKKLLNLYYEYITKHREILIERTEMWNEISQEFPGRSPLNCKSVYLRMRKKYKKHKANPESVDKPLPYNNYFKMILATKHRFVKNVLKNADVILIERDTYKDIGLPIWKVELALKYYLKHLEEFLHPKYEKKYVWIELSEAVGIPVSKIFRKINYLKQTYKSETKKPDHDHTNNIDQLLEEIAKNEAMFQLGIGTEITPMSVEEETAWSDIEIEQLLHWYLENLEKFKNPKFLTSYLWMEASKVLIRSPVSCSNTMHDIRTTYSAMVKENPEALDNWRFYGLCQRIYGTGKK